MKNKISLLTLVACAAAGTAFAADPVVAFRASSGTTTNPTDTTYVGNSTWGADSKALGEKYFSDIYRSRGSPFSWDSGKGAFFTEVYEDEDEYWSFDAAFALEGSASFVNAAGATMTFSYTGDRGEYEDILDPSTGETAYYVYNENMLLLAGTSKFLNAGTLRFEVNSTSESYVKAPGFSFYLCENAVLENVGKFVAGEYVGYSLSSWEFDLFGNAKLINAAGGEIGQAVLDLYGNSVLENAGTFGSGVEICLSENAKVVNTGIFDTGGKPIWFDFGKGYLAGTAKFENRGEMTLGGVSFEIFIEEAGALPASVSSSFENYGTISHQPVMVANYRVRLDDEYYDGDMSRFVSAYESLLQKSDLSVKNFGVVDGGFGVSSGVKLSLAEGSRINGDVSVGKKIEFSDFDEKTGAWISGAVQLEKDVLSVVLTGSGGIDPLISGDIQLGNLVELDVSFSEDALKKTKYEFSIWGGELIVDTAENPAGFIESSLSGTLSNFGTTYEWALDTETGVLTAKDVNIGDEVDITSGTQNVALGPKDVATIDSSLTEYSGTLSGSGEVHSEADLTFTGNAGSLTGTISVDKGTMTVAAEANLGSSATLDVAGTLALEGTRTVENATNGGGTIELAAGADVKFTKSVGVKTLNVSDGATLSGGVSMTHGADAVLNLTGTLALDADAGEKVSLGGGKVAISSTAKLDLGGNAASGAAQTQAFFADATNASALERGAMVTIFEGGNVDGDAVAFLSTDSTLSALANQYAVIYDASNGLTVRALTNPEALSGSVDTSDLSSSFVAWSLGGLADELSNLPVGFTDVSALSALGGGNDPLMNALLAGDAGTARSILDRLSPKSYAAMIAMPVETFHDDARNLSARLAQRRFEKFVAAAPWEFFAQAQIIAVDNDTATDAPTFDFDRYGVFAGADFRLDETTTLGLALGAGRGDADIHNGGGKIESDDYRLTAFGGKTFGENAYVNAGAQIGFASYDVKRTTDYGAARGESDGWNAGAFAEAGVSLAISEANRLYATPYVGLAYTHAETDSFKEDGGAAAFDADSLNGDSLRARIGCAFSWGFDVAGARWRVGLDAAYSRELLDDEIDVDVTALDGAKISEKAAALPEDVFSIGPTLNVDVSVSASVYAGYAFNAGTDSSTTHSANVGFRMRF